MSTVAIVVAALAHVTGGAQETMARPVIFVHGNGDSAALWHATIWRFESNGYDPRLLFAVDMRHPSAPPGDSMRVENRSTTTDQAAQLAAEVARVLIETGSEDVVLVGSSRGGNTIRNYVKRAGGHANTAIAILCGTANHGIFTSDESLDSEWNARGRFVQTLNAGSEVHPDVRFVTIRSDRNDKYAQPRLATDGGGEGVSYDSPALAGAENIVLDTLDHREVAYHPRAFREMFRVITGRLPATLEPTIERRPRLDGMVSGWANAAPTNLPLRGARVRIYEVDPDTAIRLGDARHDATTGADGRWGPFEARPDGRYEFVVEADGYPITHVYRSPFPRSSRYVHLRLRPVPEADRGAEAVVALSRPRGYFGLDRDVVMIDGTTPDGIPDGVPTVSWVTRHFAARPDRPVALRFNDERITVRTHPASDGHLVIGELHY